MQRRRVFTLAPLVAILLLWVGFTLAAGAVSRGPGSTSFGEDADVYLTAAHVVASGGNPYDSPKLYRAEVHLLRRQGIDIAEPRSLVRVGNPPLFFWLLGPLLRLPFRAAILTWVLGMLAAAVIGFLGTLVSTGPPARLMPLFLFLAMPFVTQGVLYGEVTPLYFAGIGAALALAPRYPVWAGAVLILAWLKPTMALPLVLLVILFYSRDPMRSAAGFAGVSIAGLAATVAVLGREALTQWIAGLLSFSDTLGSQPGLASATGFYVRWTPSHIRTALEFATILVALAGTALWWRHCRHSPRTLVGVAWLWPAWMLATPYAHYPDEMVLAVPALALLVTSAGWALNRWAVITLYLGALSLWFGLTSTWTVQLTPIVPLIAALCCVAAYRSGAIRSPFVADERRIDRHRNGGDGFGSDCMAVGFAGDPKTSGR